MIEFRGREQWGVFLETVERANREGGTISPGGAGAMLGITRQRAYTIAQDHADVRAWAYYDEGRTLADVFEISVEDLLRWAVRRGRIKSEADLGLPWSRVKETLARILQSEAQVC